MKKNIIVITGGAGFVGTNLINLLLKKTKYKIISIDNYSSGLKKNHIKNKRINYVNTDTKNISKILKNPNPDNCIQMLIYRIEHDNFNEVIDLDKQQVLEIPNRVYATLNEWITESLSELINNVLSLPPGSERDEAKRILKQRRDTLFDKSLKSTLYSVCRSLKILN